MTRERHAEDLIAKLTRERDHANAQLEKQGFFLSIGRAVFVLIVAWFLSDGVVRAMERSAADGGMNEGLWARVLVFNAIWFVALLLAFRLVGAGQRPLNYRRAGAMTDIKREWQRTGPGEYRCAHYAIRWDRVEGSWDVYWVKGGCADDLLAHGFQTVGAVRRWLMDNWRRLETEEEPPP